jgi:hypothetical protein
VILGGEGERFAVARKLDGPFQSERDEPANVFLDPELWICKMWGVSRLRS